MALKVSKTPEGVKYSYFVCNSCGEEILSMKQLECVAKEYRELRKYNVKLTKWGESYGMRIPKDLVKKEKLDKVKELVIIPEKVGFRVVPV